MELETAIKIDTSVRLAKNLVGRLSELDCATIGQEVWEGYERDVQSRKPWENQMQAAMNLAMQIQEPKNYPWPGCSNVIFPLVTIAALQFSARSYANIIQGTNVVKYRTIGKDKAGEVRDRALRIGRHMSWQVLEEDEPWEEQHDRLLINLSIVGCNFVKTYFDAELNHIVSDLVLAKDFVMDYYAKSVESAARKTHRIPLSRNEIHSRCARGIFVDVRDANWFKSIPFNPAQTPEHDKRMGLTPPRSDEQTPFYFLEQHRWLDLDGDGYYEPYIATVEEKSKCLVRLVARWERDEDVERLEGRIFNIKPAEYFTKYSFIPAPDGGIYDLGFGVFLGPINEAVNSGINQLIDFGTMQTSSGGFLGRGSKIRGGAYTFAPWEWKRVDSTGDDLRKNIVPFPERSPNETMFKLLGLLIEYANRIAGTVDATVGENPGQNTPASTYQGMTEQGLQIFGMTFKRVWRSLRLEFKRRFELNRVHIRTTQSFGSDDDFIRREDYTGNPDQVAPVANPRVTSTVMRTQQAIAMKQSSMGTPGYDIYEVEKDFLMSLEVEGIDRLYPGPGKVPENHEMKNPKAMVEQMKMEGKKMEVEAQKQEWANKLMEERRLNNAKIALLEAQAMQAMADTNATTAATQIEAFDKMIQFHKEWGQQLNDRISALGGGKDDSQDGKAPDGDGMGGPAGQSGNAGDQSVSVSVPGGSQVSVGSGSVQH